MKNSIKNSDLETIRQHEVAKLFGVTQKTIIEWCKNPKIDFPKRLHLGPNATSFYKKDIVEYLQKCEEFYDDNQGDSLPKSLQDSNKTSSNEKRQEG